MTEPMRRAATAAMRRHEPYAATEAAYARVFSTGWLKAVEWASGSAYAAGRSDAEAEIDEAYETGLALGAGQARADNDALFGLGYADGLRASAEVVRRLQAQLTECKENHETSE